MSDIEKAMQSILNGNATETSVELVAVAKIIQAAEILSQSGFEDDSKIVLSALKNDPYLKKEASLNEEVLFEVTENS